MNKSNSGVTLLELTLALFLLGIVVFSAGNLLLYSANAGGRHVEKQESFENARIGLDFLLGHTRTANEIKLTAETGTNLLKRIDLHTDTYDGEHVYIFTFDKNTNRLNFGGSKNYPFTSGVNELASGLKRVEMFHDTEIDVLYFSVVVDDGDDEIVLNGGVDVRYKKMNH